MHCNSLTEQVIDMKCLNSNIYLFLVVADINAKSYGELQSPIHYAAKFNAVQALKVLIDGNAAVNDRDYKRRTPLFLAAETGQFLKHMLIKYAIQVIQLKLIRYQ